ncbi:hypothetical protein KCP70_05465 [Salmonella enterica subsp. enterica]|nr:hypothetical protein KCP70_05465 [Salmonella enterica subsp. enterica]
MFNQSSARWQRVISRIVASRSGCPCKAIFMPIFYPRQVNVDDDSRYVVTASKRQCDFKSHSPLKQ